MIPEAASYEIEFYVPMTDNDGKAYPDSLLRTFKQQLVDCFGGVTDTRHQNEGVWKVHGIEYRDAIVVWRVFTDDESQIAVVTRLQKEMEKKLKQEKVLCLLRKVALL